VLIAAVRYDRIGSSGANRTTSVADVYCGRTDAAVDVVEDVKRSAVRRNGQVGVFHPDIGHLHVGQIERQGMPRVAIVMQ
jgi:hypothetical protein